MPSNYLLILSLAAFMAHYSLALPYHRSYPYANSHDRSDVKSPFGFRGLNNPKRSFGSDPYNRNRKIDESFILGNSGRGRGEEPQRKRNQYDIINEARMAYSGDTPNRSSRQEQEYGPPNVGLDHGNMNKFYSQPRLPSPPARHQRQPKQIPKWKKLGVPSRETVNPHFEHSIPLDTEDEVEETADYDN